MTIPKLTPYTGQVANPDGSQTQTEFTQNMFDQLSYEAQLATELDATVDGMNQAVTDVEDSANAASASANAAEAAASTAGYQGLWPDTGGSAEKGETWQTQVGGTPTGEYYTALQNTGVDPVGDNVNWNAQNDYGIVASDGLVVKHRRGTNAEILAGTPDIGELWFNTTDNSVHMGDGFTLGGIKHINVNTLPEYSGLLFDTVDDAKSANVIPSLIDQDDLELSTKSYYGGWVVGEIPTGGQTYLATTLARARVKLGAGWEPDGYVTHYMALAGGSTYVLIPKNFRTLRFEQCGAIGGGVDDTLPCQATVDFLNSVGGGEIYNDSLLFYCNIKWDSYVSYRSPSCDVGFAPFSDSDVISLKPNQSVVKFGFDNLFIRGNPSFTNSSNLVLATTGVGNICDQLYLRGNTALIDAGKYNMHLKGESAVAPFVQGLVCTGELRVERAGVTDLLLEGDVIESYFSAISGGGSSVATGPGIHFLENAGATPQRCRIGKLVYGGNPTSGQVGLKLDGFKSVNVGVLNLESMDTLLQVTANANNGSLIIGDATLQTSHSITTALDLFRCRLLDIRSLEILAGGSNIITNGVNFNGFGVADIPQLKLPQIRFANANVTNEYVNYSNEATVTSNTVRAYRDMITLFSDGATINTIADISGQSGANSSLVDGDRLTMQSFPNFTHTITESDNIKTKTGGNLVLTGNDYATFVYNRRLDKWLQN